MLILTFWGVFLNMYYTCIHVYYTQSCVILFCFSMCNISQDTNLCIFFFIIIKYNLSMGNNKPSGITKLSSHPQRELQILSVASCIEVASPLLCLDYTAMRGMGTSGNVEYRCWPSYSQQGCVLSVHSVKEAAYICNSHSQCNSFTLTGQKTWTG